MPAVIEERISQAQQDRPPVIEAPESIKGESTDALSRVADKARARRWPREESNLRTRIRSPSLADRHLRMVQWIAATEPRCATVRATVSSAGCRLEAMICEVQEDEPALAGDDKFHPAELGNDRRPVTIDAQRKLLTRVSAALEPMRRFLVAVVSQPDNVLMCRSLALPVPADDEIVNAPLPSRERVSPAHHRHRPSHAGGAVS